MNSHNLSPIVGTHAVFYLQTAQEKNRQFEIEVQRLKAELALYDQPTIPIPEGAIAIHGITDEMVKDAPNFCEVYPQIVAALAGKEVLIYNANFDIRISGVA